MFFLTSGRERIKGLKNEIREVLEIMRIISAKEFLQMKPPVIFQKYDYMGDWGGLCLMYEACPLVNDFYYVDLMSSDILVNGNEVEDSELVEKLEELERTRGNFERDYECGQRDSLFDMQQRYVVYDENDLRHFIKTLQEVIKK